VRFALGVDASREAIAAAKKLAVAHGVERKTRFRRGDLLAQRFAAGAFDAVVINMALHHVLDVEGLLYRVKRWKTSAAPLVLHEYIGPNRFQWTPAAVAAGSRLLSELPPSLRVHGQTGKVVETFAPPAYREMLFGDPSEAIRSADLVDIAGCYFDLIERRDFGGTLLQPLLADIIHNFRPAEDAEHAAALERLFEEERSLLADHTLASNFALLVYR